eukprot:3366122-Amphidinium_carterae.1
MGWGMGGFTTKAVFSHRDLAAHSAWNVGIASMVELHRVFALLAQRGQDTEMNAAGDRRSASDRVVGHATAMQLMQANPGARILIGPPDSQATTSYIVTACVAACDVQLNSPCCTQGSVAVQPSSAEAQSHIDPSCVSICAR